MKRLLFFVSSLALLVTSSNPVLAEPRYPIDVSHELTISVGKLTVRDFSDGKIVLAVGLIATSTRSLTIDRVEFSDLQINGVPVYGAPLDHRLKLRRGTAVTLAQPLIVTIDLRDLRSLEPLRNAVAERGATLQGKTLVRVPLSALAQLISLSRHAEISADLHQQVALNIPGGDLGWRAIVKMLDLAQSSVNLLQWMKE